MALSVLAEFDDIRRCMEVFMDDTCEQQFLKFATYQEECRLQWSAAVQEAQRLQRELDTCLQNLAEFETKLFHARRLLELEKKTRQEAEHERDQLEKKLMKVAEYIQDSPTREKLDFLKHIPKKRKSAIPHTEEKYGGNANDINSTGSFLSDLSVTHSEDDFLDVHASRTWKKHRPSLPKQSGTFIGMKQRNARKSAERIHSSRNSNQQQHHNQVVNVNENDKICATTKVLIPKHGPIKAESIIETVPSVPIITQTKKFISIVSTATSSGPSATATTSSNGEKSANDEFFEANDIHMKTGKTRSPSKEKFPPSAPPLLKETNVNKKIDELTPNTPHLNENVFKTSINTPSYKHTLKRSIRGHVFSTKTFLKSDTCIQCQKKIRFGSVALKCKNCQVCVHQDCKEIFTIACVPPAQGTPNGTPTQKAMLAFLTDYAPPNSPMIPAIIVHLVNEIESRGLDETGLYRISGSEREVKALKEKFLRGKKPQNLTHTDVHVLCGCVKDFLRCLREPLIPTDLWSDFAQAVQSSTEEEKRKDLHRAVNRLPQANRDTLGFLILHFQRIAQCPEVKMPLGNLARVFGPTIIGYSSPNPDQNAIFTETMTQYEVMDNLLKIPSEYWSQFTQFSDSEYYEQSMFNKTNQPSQTSRPKESFSSIYATPFRGTLRKTKFYGTPPFPSAKKVKY